jgi:hypothetical protein
VTRPDVSTANHVREAGAHQPILMGRLARTAIICSWCGQGIEDEAHAVSYSTGGMPRQVVSVVCARCFHALLTWIVKRRSAYEHPPRSPFSPTESTQTQPRTRQRPRLRTQPASTL